MSNLFEPPHTIAIEGPIRAGKSTLARTLAERLKARRIVEPENNPFLSAFYRGKAGTAFSAQMWFLEARHAQMLEEKKIRTSRDSGCERPVVADYLFEKDKIFACINLSDTELDLYDRYYELFRVDVPPPDLVIYLEADASVLRQRLKRKNAAQEQAISDAYLNQVIAAYKHFFFRYSASDLLVVDTSRIDFVEHNRDLQLLMKRLSEPVRGTQYFLPLQQSGDPNPGHDSRFKIQDFP